MTRAAAALALAWTAALAIWFTGRLALGDAAPAAGLTAAGALLITQGIAALLVAPWLVSDEHPAPWPGLVPLLVTPWPLLALAVSIAGLPALKMAASQVGVLALILLSFAGARGLRRLLPGGQLRTIALTTLQVIPVVALWAGRDAWVPWFTG